MNTFNKHGVFVAGFPFSVAGLWVSDVGDGLPVDGRQNPDVGGWLRNAGVGFSVAGLGLPVVGGGNSVARFLFRVVRLGNLVVGRTNSVVGLGLPDVGKFDFELEMRFLASPQALSKGEGIKFSLLIANQSNRYII